MNPLFPWLHEPLQRTLDALAADRLAHALLVCGPAHIGKRAFAEALAQSILCRERIAGSACGQCRGCVLFAAGTHPDMKRVCLEENEKTKVMRKEIVIEQVRDLGAWFALTPQRGGAQVALLDPAALMNQNASNALLKTLEEPMPGRYLLLLCESPMQLSATIRSRCQRIVLQSPSSQTGSDWLRARGHAAALAESALAAAHGHPGLAAHWIEADLLALREAVRTDLAAISDGRAQPLGIATAWLADAQIEQRLAFAAELALDQQARQLSVSGPASSPFAAMDPPRLAAWFDQANRTRALLRTPIRQDLAVAELLRDWRNAVAA